ncbi:MAG: LEA type 2 family protein [Syntrophales bacterium]
MKRTAGNPFLYSAVRAYRHTNGGKGMRLCALFNLRAIVGAACFGLLLLIISCKGWIIESPTIILKDITVQQISLTELNLLLGMDIENPNSFDLELKALEFKLFLNDDEIGTGILQNELLVPKSCISAVHVPIAASYKNPGSYLKFLLGGRDLNYRLEGKAKIKSLLGTKSIPFKKEGQVRLGN